jgi:hypothetical protein
MKRKGSRTKKSGRRKKKRKRKRRRRLRKRRYCSSLGYFYTKNKRRIDDFADY